MNRVAVFGNAGGGKSRLAKKLAGITGLPLHPVDSMKYKVGGEEVPHADYLEIHAGLLRNERWIIEGFGCVVSAWERFAAADTLVYVDLPLVLHYLWVTKRFIKGMVVNPEGWPENSPMWRGTLAGYRMISLCHRHMTPKYRQLVAEADTAKRVASPDTDIPGRHQARVSRQLNPEGNVATSVGFSQGERGVVSVRRTNPAVM